MPFQTDIIASSDTASRYSHLLQPIRDLTKNWDVDVAAQLEEYLAEIERIKISFDEGKTTMNFAEAALVIQGSACVYSKKVEYLYTLVYQTLDLIASKKRLQQASSVDDQGKDTDASFKDEIEELQPLDDIKEATNIYLKDDEHVADRGIMARTPLALIPLGEEDKQDVLYSSTGEIIGSRNDFKMNTCIVHASGALLLDSTYLPLIDGSFKRLMTSTPGTAQDIQPRGDEQVPDEVMSDAVEVPAVDLPFEGMGPDDDFEPIELELMDTVCDGGVDDAGDEQEVQEGGEEREGLRARRTPQPNPVQHVPFKDPWELMNHHDPGHWKSCPLKKGKPFKLPPSLVSEQQTKKRKRKGAIPPEPKPPLVPINQFISNAFYSHASKMSKNSLKTPTFPEFEYLYWIEFRRRQKIEAKQRQLLSQLATEEEIEELYSIVQKNEDEEMRYNDDKEDSDDDDNFAGGADEEVCYGSADAADPIAPMALEEPSEGVILSSYEELVRRYVEGYLTDAQHYAQETELTRRVREWEEKIVPVLSQEDMHRPFDIHKYGEEILDSFKAKPDQTFKTVVTGKEPFEICRLFLATLQLANNYNVEITADGIGETAVDTMKLRLLKRTPGNEAIAAFGGQSLA